MTHRRVAISIAIVLLSLPIGSSAAPARLVPIPLTQASGPLTLKPFDRVLLVNNTHVSARELLALDRRTLVLKWRYPGSISGFVVYAKGRIVVANDQKLGLVGLDARSGKRLWAHHGLALNSGIYPDLELRSPKIYGGNGSFVDVTSGAISGFPRGPLTPVRRYRVTKAGLRLARVEWRLLRRSGRVLAAFTIGGGAKEPVYLWTLSGRRFTLEQRAADRTMAQLGWSIPTSSYKKPVDRYFNGEPEPEKLVASLHLVDGKLVFYEQYEIYRWSWGRGTNRLTLIDLRRMAIERQIWGQRHHPDPYRQFVFRDTFVFGADGVDADLSQSKHYQLLSLERLKKTGLLDKSVQPGAPKIPACHQLIQLAPVLLACLRTTSKQVKPKQYRYTLIYNPIALLRSQPPPPVTLLDGPDHPEQFVVDPSLDRLLVVVDQRQHGHRRALLVYTVPRVF